MNGKRMEQSKTVGNATIAIAPFDGRGEMQFGGRGLAVLMRGAAVSNLEITLFERAHRLPGTDRISSQLHSSHSHGRFKVSDESANCATWAARFNDAN